MRRRVAILISGRGSNMAALIDAAAMPDFPAEIVLVVADRPDAAGLEIAARAGIRTETVDRRSFADKAAFEEALDDLLDASGSDLVCLAGFMRVLGDGFVARWHDRLLNIHPSLLPSFPGLDTHARALAAGVRLHGCTVHVVRSAVDDGPIVAQAAIPVLADDTAETLGARVLAAEHRLYPLALALIAGGRAKVDGEHVRVAGEDADDAAVLIAPAP